MAGGGVHKPRVQGGPLRIYLFSPLGTAWGVGCLDCHLPPSGWELELTGADPGEDPTPKGEPPPPFYGGCGGNEQKKVGKKVEMGENPKIPYPQCGRSIKTYSQTTMIPP